jgi:hypothetical protein
VSLHNKLLGPVRFEKIREQREKAVIQRLVEIRKAEVEYKNQNGKYTANFDTLFQFIKTAKKKRVIKEGTLTDKQLKSGLTEAKAAEIVRKGQDGNLEKGLAHFRRDMWR